MLPRVRELGELAVQLATKCSAQGDRWGRGLRSNLHTLGTQAAQLGQLAPRAAELGGATVYRGLKKQRPQLCPLAADMEATAASSYRQVIDDANTALQGRTWPRMNSNIISFEDWLRAGEAAGCQGLRPLLEQHQWLTEGDTMRVMVRNLHPKKRKLGA